ncbi:allatostatin double C [Anticarsia gemmatalis]|uniref:allatostatin double C n=1 Tax=Anticarsia gemmatalis TaxID=129554 RepID=UPI003F76F539
MMCNSVPLLLLALTSVLAAPAPMYNDDYPEIVHEKRAALVLDRLLVALQKALHEESPQHYRRLESDEPRTAPLRSAEEEINDVSVLQRRGQTGNSRGRVLRCYFNAVTCF